jgi:Fe-S-cluster containining protein
MPKAPWFRDGLKFQCTQCGNCCTGAPGYVWVDQEEIAAIAKSCGETVAEFERQFVRQVGARKSLIEFDNGDCVFLDPATRKCGIYDLRPRQCRTWPFWESNINDAAAWKHTCEVCPGSGKGTLYTVDEILAQSAVIKI